jgi:transposase
MARPYSKDLRDRVAVFVVSGGTCREAAARFGVGVATAVRWSQRLRTSLFAIEQDRPDVARKRDRWRRHQARLDPRRLD